MKVWVLQTTNYENIEPDSIDIFGSYDECKDMMDKYVRALQEDFDATIENSYVPYKESEVEIYLYRKNDEDKTAILNYQIYEREIERKII